MPKQRLNNFDLLLQALRIDDPDSAICRAEEIISENQIDWDDLYASADLHAVKPQLSKLLSQIGRDLIPASFTEKLNEECRHILFNQLSYVDDFFNIRDFLEEDGIQIIPFKGFWLAHDAYGNLADRESMDVDVFINIRDLAQIKTLMEGNGYREEDTFKKFTLEEIITRFQEYNFDRIERDISRFHIEFHWGICPPGYGMGIRMEDLASQTKKVRFSDHEIEVFTPVAHLLLVLMHHGGKDRFLLLKQVNDIAHVLSKHEDIDWTWLISVAKRFDAEQLIYVGANLAATLTGVSVPEDLRAQAESKIIESLAKNRILSMMRPHYQRNNMAFHYNNWLFRMRTRTGIGTRIKITTATGRELLLKFLSASSK